MNHNKFFIGLIIILFGILAGCSPSSGEVSLTEVTPTAAVATSTIPPTATNTKIPTATNTMIPTETLIPTVTSSPTPETIEGPEVPQFLPIPMEAALAEWQGIPVLQEAIGGQKAYSGYIFSIEMPVADVQKIYQGLMKESGWRLVAVGEAEDGSVVLQFQVDSDQVSITIFNIPFSFDDPVWGYQAPASFVLIVH